MQGYVCTTTVRPLVEGVFKSDAHTFSTHTFSKHDEESINLLAGIGVEFAGLRVKADAHCGVPVRG